MTDRLKQVAWYLGYVLLCGEGLWLILSLATLVAASLFFSGLHSTLLQKNIGHLASTISFVSWSLLPGALLGFLFLSEAFEIWHGSLWMPIALILIPLVGVAQSTILTILFYIFKHQGSFLVIGAGIFWLVILGVGVWNMARSREVLFWTLGAIAFGLLWGGWIMAVSWKVI
jgi:hypothetical protein